MDRFVGILMDKNCYAKLEKIRRDKDLKDISKTIRALIYDATENSAIVKAEQDFRGELKQYGKQDLKPQDKIKFNDIMAQIKDKPLWQFANADIFNALKQLPLDKKKSRWLDIFAAFLLDNNICSPQQIGLAAVPSKRPFGKLPRDYHDMVIF